MMPQQTHSRSATPQVFHLFSICWKQITRSRKSVCSFCQVSGSECICSCTGFWWRECVQRCVSDRSPSHGDPMYKHSYVYLVLQEEFSNVHYYSKQVQLQSICATWATPLSWLFNPWSHCWAWYSSEGFAPFSCTSEKGLMCLKYSLGEAASLRNYCF